MILKAPAILSAYSPKVDGSMTLRFTTQEMSDEQKMYVLTFYQKFGWLLFKENDDIEVPPENAKREGKSKSQRLRASLYVLMKKKHPDLSAGEIEGKIDTYMEDLIAKVQDKIDEL